MPWQLVFDINQAPRFGGDGIGMLAAFVAIAVGILLYASVWRGQGGGRLAILRSLAGVFALLAGVAIGVLALIAAQRTTTRLQNNLVAGNFSEVSGTVAQTRLYGTERGAGRLVFSVGAHRFMFPFHNPQSCFPQNGEAARIDFVPNAGADFTALLIRWCARI